MNDPLQAFRYSSISKKVLIWSWSIHYLMRYWKN